MSKEKLTIWGRDFELDVCIECYPGETVQASQENALAALLNVTNGIETAKERVEEYVMANNSRIFPDGEMDNIFRYVMPVSIFVPHDRKRSLAAILCNYRFDMEHGLAIVFENGVFQSICPQDDLL